jgi:zinc transport system permease protein
MLEIFSYTFMKNAACAGVLIGILCSVLSVFVVLKRMAFIGQGIAHAAFGGIAFALLFNLNVFFTTLAFCILVGVLIGVVSRKGKVSEDSSIGLFLTTSMALGVIFLNLRKEYTSDVFSYLFGNILSVTASDVVKTAVLTVIVLGLMTLWYRPLQFFAFDEEMAAVAGVPVTFLYFLLLITLSVVIVFAVQVAGVVLVSALLIIPATIALLLARRFLPVMLLSVAAGIIATCAGLVASYYARVSSGAAMVVVLFTLFIIAFLIRKLFSRK